MQSRWRMREDHVKVSLRGDSGPLSSCPLVFAASLLSNRFYFHLEKLSQRLGFNCL